MALILNIDTAVETALISISEGENVLAYVTNSNQKDHSAFLQPAIKTLLQQTNYTVKEIEAVAVTAGPGSYTGLRVGMASAKGLCYALKIPLLTINTLEMMALSSIKQSGNKQALYCPMIDARRMEVYTAVYDSNLSSVVSPTAMIIEANSFKKLLENPIYFSGSGTFKLKTIIQHSNAKFLENEIAPQALAILSNRNYSNKMYADIAYASPFYLKEFYSNII